MARNRNAIRDPNATAAALRTPRNFSALALLAGIGAGIAGAGSGDAVPLVLGAVAAVCGAVLAVFVILARRRTRS